MSRRSLHPMFLGKPTLGLLLGLLGGCGLLGKDARKPFSNDAPSSRATLVLIGGNSECEGRTGLWPLSGGVADDVAKGLGFHDKRDISFRYFSWTGDLPGTGSCLPDRLNYLNGEKVIFDSLKADQLLERRSIVVIGWSNGGATANQLSALISKASESSPVDQLVTLDPVSFWTERQDVGRTLTWQNVYIRSESFRSRFWPPGNLIAGLGKAWNDFGPDSQPCIEANHRDVWKMWNEVLRGARYAAWVERHRATAPAATVAGLHPNPVDGSADRGSRPCRP